MTGATYGDLFRREPSHYGARGDAALWEVGGRSQTPRYTTTSGT